MKKIILAILFLAFFAFGQKAGFSLYVTSSGSASDADMKKIEAISGEQNLSLKKDGYLLDNFDYATVFEASRILEQKDAKVRIDHWEYNPTKNDSFLADASVTRGPDGKPFKEPFPYLRVFSSIVAVAGIGLATYFNIQASSAHDDGIEALKMNGDENAFRSYHDDAEKHQNNRNYSFGLAGLGFLGLGLSFAL